MLEAKGVHASIARHSARQRRCAPKPTPKPIGGMAGRVRLEDGVHAMTGQRRGTSADERPEDARAPASLPPRLQSSHCCGRDPVQYPVSNLY